MQAQDWEREELRFTRIREMAAERASRPYEPPQRTLPDWLDRLTPDQVEDIRFHPPHALWAAEQLPFTAMLFHPGPQVGQTVFLHEFTDSHQQKIRFSEAFFEYGSRVPGHAPLPADLGFAGFRVHYPLNRADYKDELIAFPGGCHWRALGQNQRYGLSARGIAINTGLPDVQEEFPVFQEFWLGKPSPKDTYLRFYALLDGPSCSGAYSFKVRPGQNTQVDVRAVIYARNEIRRLGIAPASSMFWYGENSRRRFDDVRPEVHDSDGLAIRMGTGECIWRPLSNDSGQQGVSFFNMDQCQGFGLLQRDREPASYDDAEASYDRRPSLWIEPVEEWGAGQVMLLEMPASNGLGDNVVALWEPALPLGRGQSREFRYRQVWTMDPDPAGAGARVVATRTGLKNQDARQRLVMIDFAGPKLLQDSESGSPTARVELLGDGAQRATVEQVSTIRTGKDRLRVSFHIAPIGDASASPGALEMRCQLLSNQQPISETWAYRIMP